MSKDYLYGEIALGPSAMTDLVAGLLMPYAETLGSKVHSAGTVMETFCEGRTTCQLALMTSVVKDLTGLVVHMLQNITVDTAKTLL